MILQYFLLTEEKIKLVIIVKNLKNYATQRYLVLPQGGGGGELPFMGYIGIQGKGFSANLDIVK